MNPLFILAILRLFGLSPEALAVTLQKTAPKRRRYHFGPIVWKRSARRHKLGTEPEVHRLASHANHGVTVIC